DHHAFSFRCRCHPRSDGGDGRGCIMIPARNTGPDLDARRRRAAAEADEIAVRAVHRRQDGVPVHDFAPGGNPFVIYGVPEADGPGSGRRPIAWGAVFIWIWVVAVVL